MKSLEDEDGGGGGGTLALKYVSMKEQCRSIDLYAADVRRED